MKKESILVVEDEEDIRELVSYNLLKEGYQVAQVVSGEEALDAVEERRPDLIVLDLMLPGISGNEVCKALKSETETESIPIVMLTAKGEESDIVAGLDQGADDYITKPFSPKVLTSRVNAVLRRASGQGGFDDGLDDDTTIQIHNITIHPGRHEVLIKGKPVDLTSTEFRLLHFLGRRPGWVFTRQQILDAMHGESYSVTDRAVDVQVVGLRKKLGSAGKYIETVRGVGYRLKE